MDPRNHNKQSQLACGGDISQCFSIETHSWMVGEWRWGQPRTEDFLSVSLYIKVENDLHRKTLCVPGNEGKNGGCVANISSFFFNSIIHTAECMCVYVCVPESVREWDSFAHYCWEETDSVIPTHTGSYQSSLWTNTHTCTHTRQYFVLDFCLTGKWVGVRFGCGSALFSAHKQKFCSCVEPQRHTQRFDATPGQDLWKLSSRSQVLTF